MPLLLNVANSHQPLKEGHVFQSLVVHLRSSGFGGSIVGVASRVKESRL